MKSDNQIIHEARVDENGKPLCWHNFVLTKPPFYKCVCGLKAAIGGDGNWLDSDNFVHPDKVNPNYLTDPGAYLTALNEFRERWSKEKWHDFNIFVAVRLMADHVNGMGYHFICVDLLNPEKGVPLISEFLKKKEA
jgi:hypothetical protein